MKMVFIAGAYFGDGTYEDIEKNIRLAEEYAIALVNEGIGFFCPHLNSRHFEIKTDADEEFYKEMDMKILKICDALIVIPGWEKSNGVKREIIYARNNNIPTFYLESVCDIRRFKQVLLNGN